MRFIESICFEDGHYINLNFHNARWSQTHQRFFQTTPPHILEVLPEIQEKGVLKVRVVYDQKGHEVSHLSYKKRHIKSLQVVDSKPFDYSYKFEDRASIESLRAGSSADDIIICINGKITDSSYANLAFWDGKEWVTPEGPLLEGVRRVQLLSEGKIKATPIQISDLRSFEKVSLINAMLDLGTVEIPMSNVHLTS